MKNVLIALIGLLAFGGFFYPQTETLLGGTTIATFQGGTGTSTQPTYGKILLGNDNGRYDVVATSTLGFITASSIVPFSFTPETWWGQSANATSTALHLKGTPFSLFASSTAVFNQASTTQFTVNNLYFGGSVPTLGSCGTAAITATSTDNRGTIVVTAGTPTTCQLSYSTPKPDTPTCVVSTNSVSLLGGVAAASTTGVQFGLSAAFSGNIYYICLQ